jgi:Fe-S-cluster containining protein
VKLADTIIAREMANQQTDCKVGCAWCCHQLVVVTNFADGRAILKAAKERMSKRELKAFKRLVRKQAKQISALTHEEAELRQWPCPLLKEGKCSVYDVRPVACRTVFSSDSNCCKAMMEANDFEQLSDCHQQLASEISERAVRLQFKINDRRPIDVAMELRSLLVSLMDK